jgi:hypothetical protein
MTAPWPLVENMAEERTPSNRPVGSTSKTGSTVDGQPEACSTTQHKHPNRPLGQHHPTRVQQKYRKTNAQPMHRVVTHLNTRQQHNCEYAWSCSSRHRPPSAIATYNSTTKNETQSNAATHQRQASRVYAKAAIRQAKSNMRI